ncbi:hypothetical protein V3481_019096 [Fusarium oxysporum f. sp. vasinfectum]
MKRNILVEYTLRSIALVLEIAALSSIFLGIQGASGYFAWFIGQRLSPSLLDTFLPGSQEALLCFVLNTIFFLVVLWGILPFYSIRKELPFFVSGLVVCSVGLLAVALTITMQYPPAGNTHLPEIHQK